MKGLRGQMEQHNGGCEALKSKTKPSKEEGLVCREQAEKWQEIRLERWAQFGTIPVFALLRLFIVLINTGQGNSKDTSG